MLQKLQTAHTFEIHCWNEEPKQIALALHYGEEKQTDWAGRTVIYGNITPEFTSMLLCLEKTVDTEIYNKMALFFFIFFDNGFSSEHYGTELNQQEQYPR